MWDDARLLLAWRGGDTNAGDALVRRHYESIRRFFDIKVPAYAEDLTQQAFAQCCAGRDNVRDASAFRPYVFGVARRLLLRHLRDRGRFDRMASFQTAAGPDSVISPSGVVALREEHQLLLRGLDPLPADQQIVLQLHYWEQMSTADIGVVLEVPKSTVTSRLARARERLRQEIGTLGGMPAVEASLLRDLDEWARTMVPKRP